MKTTIVVVTYEQDLDLLNRLLKSIQQYWNPTDISEILVIFNSNSKNTAEISTILSSHDKPITVKLLLLADICPGYVITDGYTSQQYLKLLAANFVKTEWYIIHDSKDYYVNPISYKDFFDSTGKAAGMIDPYRKSFKESEHHSEEYQRSYEIWEVKDYDNEQILKENTPYLAYTKAVLEMLADLKVRLPPVVYKNLFNLSVISFDKMGDTKWIREFFVTEFSLLNAYMTHRNLKNLLYSNDLRSYKHVNYFTRGDKNLRRLT